MAESSNGLGTFVFTEVNASSTLVSATTLSS